MPSGNKSLSNPILTQICDSVLHKWIIFDSLRLNDCICFVMKSPFRCLSGKLWYLQHNCVGDTIVYHRDSDLWCVILSDLCTFVISMVSSLDDCLTVWKSGAWLTYHGWDKTARFCRQHFDIHFLLCKFILVQISYCSINCAISLV